MKRLMVVGLIAVLTTVGMAPSAHAEPICVRHPGGDRICVDPDNPGEFIAYLRTLADQTCESIHPHITCGLD